MSPQESLNDLLNFYELLKIDLDKTNSPSERLDIIRVLISLQKELVKFEVNKTSKWDL